MFGAGEILGIGGLLGSGRTEILESIFGVARGWRGGDIAIDGEPVSINSAADACRLGVALVTEDRKALGLHIASTIRDNVALPSVGAASRFGVRGFARESALATDVVERLDVRCSGIDQIVATLSGGNQQKVAIGKWLATAPRVLLLDEPTRGIDVGAKQEIYQLIFGLAAEGLAIVVVTSEMPELLLLSDRVLVMCEGRQTGMLSGAEATQEAIMRLAAPGMSEPLGVMSILRLLSRTKLYWGLAIICLIGALASPHTSSGRNIFLSFNNLTDVLRQVSITGLVATGMTLVILLGGIDLSVGSVMGFSTIICAMLLTQPGWTPAAIMAVPAAAIAAGLGVGFLARFVFHGLARGRDVDAGRRNEIVLGPWRGVRIPALLGLVCGALAAVATASQVSTKFGVLAVLLVTPCVALALGAINGALIVAGRLQPFIATLAMMVSALGLGRLTAGQDNAVIAVYTGTNATQAFEVLALDGLGHPADAERLFPRRDPHIRRRSALHDLRPLYLRDRRQSGSGEALGHQGGAGPIGRLSHLGPLWRGSPAFVRGPIPAGKAGRRLRPRTRRHRGRGDRRHEPDGRARRTRRNVRRRPHLRPALRHPSTPEHRFQRPAPDEGADHRRHGARAGTESGSASDAVARPSALPPPTRTGSAEVHRPPQVEYDGKNKGGHP